MISDRELPSSWSWTEFEHVASVESNLVDPAAHPNAAHVAPNHIESGTGVLLPYTTIAADKVTSPKHLFEPGQIIYSKIRPYLAKAVIVNFSGLCSADMYPVKSWIDSRYLHRWLISPEFTSVVSENQGRTLLPKINQEALAKLPVPLPPIGEQRRISVTIEDALSRSRRAKEALDEISPLLERFRQSVLAAAFRGDLTAEWRAQNPDVEPADKLLQRIRTERRRRWEEAELAKMQAKGKTPKDDQWKEKYEEPEPAATEGLPELPEGWAWASMGELTCEARIGLVRSAAEQSSTDGVAYVRMQHYDAAGRWNSADLTRVAISAEEKDEYELKEGDVLFNTRNSYELVGKVAIWGKNRPAHVFNNNLMRMRFASSILPQWMAHQMVAPAFLQTIASFKSATTSICAIYGRDLFRLPVLVAPIAEQIEANRLMDQSAARLDLLKRSTVDASSGLDSLNRSILAKAFRGDLVPQDPTDEPASVLLDRIRHERAAADLARDTSKKKKPPKRPREEAHPGLRGRARPSRS